MRLKKATAPNQVWTWDITYLKSNVRGQFFYLYMHLDLWSRMIVCWDIFGEQTSENASLLLKSSTTGIDTSELRIHSDSGSPMKGATFLATLHMLGIVPTYSRPSCSNDNAFSESLFKTIKYSGSYPKEFDSIETAKKWVERFVHWYNFEHRHSGINYITPYQRHIGQDVEILKKRNDTYLEAQRKFPSRFINGKSKKWKWESAVLLNPKKEVKVTA